MSKMPEPVAYAHRDILRRESAVERIHPTAKYGPESVALITTAQAEAYADAVRREALEEAARQCEGRHQPWGNLADDRAADCMSRAAGRIRALIK